MTLAAAAVLRLLGCAVRGGSFAGMFMAPNEKEKEKKYPKREKLGAD